MKIVLTGGGTGGHIIPLVAVANKIKEKVGQSGGEVQFMFVGPDGKMEQDLMQQAGIPTKRVMTGKMRRYFSILNIVDIFKVPIGVLQSLWVLLVYMPDAIFSKGGYASVPVVLAGWIYRIPILIHESDSVPGMTNEVLCKLANRVAVAYEEAEENFPAAQVVLTGNPLRDDINKGDPNEARKIFSLIESKKVIFIWGGSQGAKNINDKIINILPELLKKYQIIHQTGENNLEENKRKAGELGIKAGHDGYYPIAFIGDELKHFLAISDLIISRAGASSISEIAANKKPCILIPLENSANNHQKMNALAVSRRGGCVVLEENNLGGNLLISRIDEVMENNELREKLSENIGKFYHPDATEIIAEGIIGLSIDKNEITRLKIMAEKAEKN